MGVHEDLYGLPTKSYSRHSLHDNHCYANVQEVPQGLSTWIPSCTLHQGDELSCVQWPVR